MNEKLQNLLKKARCHKITEEERRLQKISFAYGNVVLSNGTTKKEDVEKILSTLS